MPSLPRSLLPAILLAGLLCGAGVMIAQERLWLTAEDGMGGIEGDWIVTGIAGSGPVSGNDITLNFTGGRLYGFGGCSALATEAVATGETLALGAVMSGGGDCPGAVLEREGALVRALARVARWSVGADGTLSLLSAGGTAEVTARR